MSQGQLRCTSLPYLRQEGGGTPRSNYKVWPTFCWHHHKRWKKKGLAWQGYRFTPTKSFFPLQRRWQRNLLYLSAQRRISTTPLCKSMRIHSTFPFPTQDTSASWYTEHPAEASVGNSANWRFANSFTWVGCWYVQGAWMEVWNHCGSPCLSYHFQRWNPPVRTLDCR